MTASLRSTALNFARIFAEYDLRLTLVCSSLMIPEHRPNH